MTKAEMIAKVLPLVPNADEAALRDALEVAYNIGVGDGMREAREAIFGTTLPSGPAPDEVK